MNIAMYLAEDIMAFWRKSGKEHTKWWMLFGYDSEAGKIWSCNARSW